MGFAVVFIELRALKLTTNGSSALTSGDVEVIHCANEFCIELLESAFADFLKKLIRAYNYVQ